MAEKDLLQVQLGKETVWGTSVAGTAKLMGLSNAQVTPTINTKIIEEMRASLDPGYQAVIESVTGGMSIEQTGLYEDICYPLEGLFGEATPSGAGPYTRNYAGINTSGARIMTGILGDGSNIYKLEGGLVNSLNIKAASGETDTEWQIAYEMIGKQIATGALAGLSDRSVIPIMASHTAVYIDTWAGTIGTTQINATAMAFELQLNRNRSLNRYLGSLTAGGHRAKKADPAGNTLKLSLEFNATSKAFIDAIIGASSVFQRQVRIKATSGTNIVQLDFAGVSVNQPTIFQDDDGLLTMDLTLQALYNSSLGNWFKAQVINGVAVLP